MPVRRESQNGIPDIDERDNASRTGNKFFQMNNSELIYNVAYSPNSFYHIKIFARIVLSLLKRSGRYLWKLLPFACVCLYWLCIKYSKFLKTMFTYSHVIIKFSLFFLNNRSFSFDIDLTLRRSSE